MQRGCLTSSDTLLFCPETVRLGDDTALLGDDTALLGDDTALLGDDAGASPAVKSSDLRCSLCIKSLL